MDGVGGQIITVDRGTRFYDNLMHLYHERDNPSFLEAGT
jgi:hypothetical protein